MSRKKKSGNKKWLYLKRLELWKAGYNDREIAELERDTTSQGIAAWRKREGIPSQRERVAAYKDAPIRVYRFREHKRMHISLFAKQYGVSVYTAYNWENGMRTPPIRLLLEMEEWEKRDKAEKRIMKEYGNHVDFNW